MVRALLVLAACVVAGVSNAQDLVTVKQLNTKMEGNAVLVGVSVTSLADKRLGFVFVNCAALDRSGNLIATGIARVDNLRPGETAYNFATLLDLKSTDYDFKCRLSNIMD